MLLKSIDGAIFGTEAELMDLFGHEVSAIMEAAAYSNYFGLSVPHTSNPEKGSDAAMVQLGEYDYDGYIISTEEVQALLPTIKEEVESAIAKGHEDQAVMVALEEKHKNIKRLMSV